MTSRVAFLGKKIFIFLYRQVSYGKLTTVQRYTGTLVHRYNGTPVQLYTGTPVQWYNGTLVHRYNGTPVHSVSFSLSVP